MFFPQEEVAVTYETNEGRFGDQLLSYLHAKWVSYAYGYPLLYKPFLFSDEFALHEIEEKWSLRKEEHFEQKIRFSTDVDLAHPMGLSLYVIPFFSDQVEDLQVHPEWTPFFIGWKDQGFRRMLRTLFSPIKPHFFDPILREEDCITVAMHIRTGESVDFPNSYLIWPMRFAPLSYYIECLHKLCDFYPNRQLFAYLFTDDLRPHDIVKQLQKSVNHLPITFGYHEKKDSPRDAITDFFSMMHFDCLIRSLSNFSLIPSLISDYKVVMTPKHSVWAVNGLSVEQYIDDIEIELHENSSIL